MLLISSIHEPHEKQEAIAESALVRRAQQGDATAISSLYCRHACAAYALALRLCAQPALAEDILQDSFVRVLEGMNQFRGDAPFAVWLKRTVAHLSIDALRARKRWQFVDHADHVSEAAVSLSTDRQLDALGLLQRLRPQARAVLVLYEMEGLSHDELAVLFQRSPSYSKSLLSRTKRQLALWIDESQPPPERAGESS